MKITVCLFLLCLSFSAHAQTYLLRLQGVARNEAHSKIIQDLEALIIEPLNRNGGFSVNSYNMKIDGPGRYFFNLALEPKSPSDQKAFQKYAQMIQGQTFRGQPLRLEKVAKLIETATLQSGNADPNQMDPFVVNFQIPRPFEFANLAGWLQFTDTYGYALMSKDHKKFRQYVEQFINDAADMVAVTEALKKSNMMAIDPRVEIVLETGEVVPSDLDHTPFLPYKFFRNCYRPDFENGTCF